MTGSNSRYLSVYLPQSIVDAGGVQTLQLAILDDAQIDGGKRAISRVYRDANASDAGRIRRVQWEVWGPIGLSLESTSKALGTDFCQNLETRWERRLISSGKQTEVDLSALDPAGVESVFSGAAMNNAYFGLNYFSSSASAPSYDVVVFDEQDENLFAHRNEVSTQVDLSNWAVLDTYSQGSPVLDAASWRGLGRIALGSAAPMQTRTVVSPGGSTYVDTVAISPAEDVYATAVKRGSDRAWYIDASGSAVNNFAGYSLDSFETLAKPFQVGDPDVATTGIGPLGPLTMFGAQDNLYSFTDQGKPVPLSRALLNHRSVQNGIQWADPGWGWNYAITAIGLRAIQPGVDNPVGIGERMRGFTGHNGVPTALWAERGELWVVYTASNNDLYGYRGAFGPDTAGTGQPLLFPWFYQVAGSCTALFSTATTSPPVIIRANGGNLKYGTISPDGRDDLYAYYEYSEDGGTWYGTTLDRDANLLKTLRLARFRTRSMEAASSWQLAVAFDSNPIAPVTAAYVNVGQSYSTDGGITAEPLQGNAPESSISGMTIKPRFTQVAGGANASTTPPEINGVLELEYDERPEQIEEITVVVNLVGANYSSNFVWETLRQLVGSTTDGPYQIQLPDDLPAAVTWASGGGMKYAMLSSVTNRTDVKGDLDTVGLVFQVWPQADSV